MQTTIEQEVVTFTVTLNKVMEFRAMVLSKPTVRPKAAYLSIRLADDTIVPCAVFSSNEHTFNLISKMLPGEGIRAYGYFQAEPYCGEHQFTLSHAERI